MEKKENKFDFIMDIISKYFFIPMLVIIISALLPLFFFNEAINQICTWMSGITFFAWIVFLTIKIVNSLHKKDSKYKQIKWLLPFVLVPFFISLILSYINKTTESNLCFLIGALFFELYAIGYIACNIINKPNTIGIVFMSLAFIVIGYTSIYLATYNIGCDDLNKDHTLFNSLITLFSAIVSGSLTLGGVAWTIKNQKDEKLKEREEKLKEREEKLKEKEEQAKPMFDFLPLEGDGIPAGKIEFINPDKCTHTVRFYLKNSDKSFVIINKIYHDHGEYAAKKHKIINKGETFCLEFDIVEKNTPIVLEINDMLNNKHFYRLITELKGSNYTIKQHEEINETEIGNL